ncbi:MAG: TerB family tellurite resistance protein [Burkholderiales bacterium]|nr:TerB family tellurite resistance protein [Burkholderiales bacterium]
MLDALIAKFRDFVDDVAPSQEVLAQREALALQRACCGLLMEVARLDSAGAEGKRKAVSLAMRELFDIQNDELGPMIEAAGRQENRLTSYFRPVALINKRYSYEQKARFVELLWRVAMADGKIDMYEDQAVRKVADLLYVAHSDFILAKRRVQKDSKDTTLQPGG